MKKRWRVLNEDMTIPITERLFINRGLTDPKDRELFLNPDWDRHTYDPFLFSKMRKAVDRIFGALDRGEHITIHGDYDADGVTGSAVLITTLRELQKQLTDGSLQFGSAQTANYHLPTAISSYIPHRDREGYGLHRATVDLLKERGTHLIITVDCGIACVDEIAYAKEQGIDTIVVDHHQFGEQLPDGILIHPKIPGETYPFSHLAAVGVAFKLASALCIEARTRRLPITDTFEKWLLDLVSIATVTDMVQMVGENRVLETYGLKVLNKTKRPGLLALINAAGMELGSLTTESIGFGLGPRINAAGRMDHASLALELLLSESTEEAERLAREVESCNRDRQVTTRKMFEEVEHLVSAHEEHRVIVLHNASWSPALVGLVAGKYMDRLGKPVVAIGKFGERWVGSGRSFAAYDITDAMRTAGEGILTHVGGHVQACGFSFHGDEDLETLIDRLRTHAAERLTLEDLIPELLIESVALPHEISFDTIQMIASLEPFGEGNKRPFFLTRDLTVAYADRIGRDGAHLRMSLRAPTGEMIKTIAFKMGDRINECPIGSQLDIVYDMTINEWNGRREVQCKLVDFTVND